MSRPTHFDDYLYWIGAVCILWSHLEDIIADAIHHILGLPPELGNIVTSGLDLEPRAAMAKRLADKIGAHSDVRVALGAAVTQIQNIAPERNLVVHGVHGVDEETGHIWAEIQRGKYRGSEQAMDVERITEIAKGINSITESLMPVLERHGLRTKPIPPTSLRKVSSRKPADRPNRGRKTTER